MNVRVVGVAVNSRDGLVSHIETEDAVSDTPNLPAPERAPLLESLERLAIKQHRKRAGLIQHILWEYVFAHEGVAAGPKAPKIKKTAMHANGEKAGRPKARALKA